jgi:hypothetical protein
VLIEDRQVALELGRAQKTIFIAYLRNRDLQREINEGLNLIEAWNRVNTVIFYGKSGARRQPPRPAAARDARPAHPPSRPGVRQPRS